MCRIVGGFEVNSQGCLKNNIELMRDSMISGGPDDYGIFVDEGEGGVILGHRRLSIIDLSNYSHQPFCDDRYSLVFNGEIYNYQEVAVKLGIEGIKCNARSDTEVLLASFKHWGVSCVEYFDGMFAFVIFDSLEKRLYLFRDRFGVKPLYYYHDSNCFLFSSELKGLLAYPKLQKKICKTALSYFFEIGYIPAPYCILENTYKLENGCYLEVNLKQARRFGILQAIVKNRYYDIANFYKQKRQFSLAAFREVLYKSVSLRMISDVDVGVCLSGGVDSSLVCAVLKDAGYSFDTFSISFLEASYDEGNYAEEVARVLGVKNHRFACHLKVAQEIIPTLSFIYDEPFGDSSAIPTLLLAQSIKKTHKVALSADGGDELGFGYDRYFWAFNRYQKYKKYKNFSFVMKLFEPQLVVSFLQSLGINIGIDKFLRIKEQLCSQSFLEHYLIEITHFRKNGLKVNELPFLLWDQFNNQNKMDNFKQMSYFDICNYLSEDILTKVDRASMSVGVEFREPLLGKELVEFMVSLEAGDNLILENSKIISGKRIFKQFLEKFLPKNLIYRPKMGFGVPLEEWMRGELRGLLQEVLPYAQGFLNEEFIKSLVDTFDARGRVDFAKIWYLYVFCAWRKEWNI